jgi:hypothetical protein
VLPSDVDSLLEVQLVLEEPDDDPAAPLLDTGDLLEQYCVDVAYQLIWSVCHCV